MADAWNAILETIIHIGKGLEESNPKLAKNLLLNLNSYDVEKLTVMIDGFINLIEKGLSVSEDNVLDIDYIMKNYRVELEDLITKNKKPTNNIDFDK